MRLVARLVLASLAIASAPVPAVLATEDPAASPDTSTPELTLWLRGPFGTVPGNGATDDDRPLDAFVRSAPLRLETGDPDVSIGEWRASFIDLLGGTPAIDDSGLGDGGTPASGVSLNAPDVPGSYRLEAQARLSAGGDAAATWTIVVPDRDLPADGLIDVPAPRLILSAEGGTVDGWPGSGCHIYLCVDIGRLPPLRLVTRLDVVEGEELSLRLSDDSGIAAWKVTLYPIVSRVQPAVDEVGDEPESPVEFLQPAGAGHGRVARPGGGDVRPTPRLDACLLPADIALKRGPASPRPRRERLLHARAVPPGLSGLVGLACRAADGLGGGGIQRRLRLLGQHHTKDLLEGEDVGAGLPGLEVVAVALPAIGIEAHAMRVVVATEGHAHPFDGDPVQLARVSVGLLDLADDAGVHRSPPPRPRRMRGPAGPSGASGGAPAASRPGADQDPPRVAVRPPGGTGGRSYATSPEGPSASRALMWSMTSTGVGSMPYMNAR